MQRTVKEDDSKPPDYSQPGAATAETRIPASKASIEVIASLHAFVTLELLGAPTDFAPGFTSLLMTLRRVPGVFEEAFRPHRLKIGRAADCLICRLTAPEFATSSTEALDVALDQALARLGNA